jgi:oxazoline/thiazoline synthase
LTAFQVGHAKVEGFAVRISSRSVWWASSKTSCWRCLAEWVHLHDLRPERPPHDTLLRAAHILKEAIPHPSPLGLRVVEFESGESTDHAVPPRPQCPVCGDPDRLCRPFQDVTESARRKVSRLVSTVSPVTGFLTEMTSKRQGAVHYSEATFVSPRAPGLPMNLRQEISSSAGAGTTRLQSLTRCLGEAVERYCLVMQGHEPRFVASWNQLGAHRCPAEILRPFSEQQYRQREQWNRGEWGFPIIPPPFGSDNITEWSPVRSLIHQRNVMLPTQLLYFGSGQRKPLYFISDTNGCAADESLEAAVLAALLELVERDAIAVWWYNRLSRRPVEPGAIDTRVAKPWVRHLRRADRPFWLLDLTTDLAIPVAAAISESVRGSHVALGFGCHPDAEVAAAKALRELCQTSQGIEEVRPDQLTRNTMQGAFARWSVSACATRENHLTPHKAARRMDPLPVRTDFLSHCLRRLAELGYDPLALVLTRPEINWPVVRLVCPGLCHPWHRLGIARLFEAPVTMGLLDRPLTESLMNPIPFTL